MLLRRPEHRSRNSAKEPPELLGVDLMNVARASRLRMKGQKEVYAFSADPFYGKKVLSNDGSSSSLERRLLP